MKHLKVNFTRTLIFVVALSAILPACKKKEGCTDPTAENYDSEARKDDGSCTYPEQMPSTYTFENVSYTGQTERLDMLAEMVTYMKTANTTGTQVSAAKLKEMYANTGNHFSFASTNQLRNKTFSLDTATFHNYMDSLAVASQSTVAGSNGTAGVVTSNDGTKKYLFNANGVEYAQLIEKELMGAVFYYNATSVYLSDDKIGPTVDNTTVTPGKGTTMEHHWDEAFGYFGVPVDFPGNLAGIRYYGKYTNERNAVMSSNATLMNAFIKGRAAISGDEMEIKNEQRDIIRTEWERVVAATAISYLNKAKKDIADDALRNHDLSEGVAFIRALKYNDAGKITDAQIQSVLNHIGSNFYEATSAGLDNARNELSTIYGMDSIKDQL